MGELWKPGGMIQAAMLINHIYWVHWTLTSCNRGAGSPDCKVFVLLYLVLWRGDVPK